MMATISMCSWKTATTYHRKSIRLKDYDYSQGNFYFVTICTLHKRHLLGTVAKEQMVLNRFGDFIVAALEEIELHFDSISVDTYAVMPNHIHAILAFTELPVMVRARSARPRQHILIALLGGLWHSSNSNPPRPLDNS